jgi:hypothetical protein
MFDNGPHTNYTPDTKVINWDYTSGMQITYDDPNRSPGMQSPAIGLLHEMAHAVQGLEGKLDDMIANSGVSYDEWLIIEEDAVTRFETPTAQECGEDIRANYLDGFSVRVKDVLSRIRVHSSERRVPLKHYKA